MAHTQLRASGGTKTGFAASHSLDEPLILLRHIQHTGRLGFQNRVGLTRSKTDELVQCDKAELRVFGMNGRTEHQPTAFHYSAESDRWPPGEDTVPPVLITGAFYC